MTVGILPNVNSINLNRDAISVIRCSFAYRQVEGQPSKKPKKDGNKSAVATLKDSRQLVCIFQDTEPPEYSPILRKNTKVLGTIRRVGKIQVKIPHQRSPYALKFQDNGSQEGTERQE